MNAEKEQNINEAAAQAVKILETIRSSDDVVADIDAANEAGKEVIRLGDILCNAAEKGELIDPKVLADTAPALAHSMLLGTLTEHREWLADVVARVEVVRHIDTNNTEGEIGKMLKQIPVDKWPEVRATAEKQLGVKVPVYTK